MEDDLRQTAIKFNKVAEEYDFVTSLLDDNDFFVANMSDNKNSALDIGCGSGILASILSQYYIEVTGIDICEEMLEVARIKRSIPNVKYLKMDANKMSFDRKFDLIVSRTTFHHLSDIPEVLSNIKSMLLPGGKLVILDVVSDKETPSACTYIVGAFIEFIPNCIKFSFHSAIRIFRHSISKNWLAHLSTDKYFNETKFKEIYGNNLPGCAFRKEKCFLGVIWVKK